MSPPSGSYPGAAHFRIDCVATELCQRCVGPGAFLVLGNFVVEPCLPGAAGIRDQVVRGFGADLAGEAGSPLPHQ